MNFFQVSVTFGPSCMLVLGLTLSGKLNTVTRKISYKFEERLTLDTFWWLIYTKDMHKKITLPFF